MTVRIITCREGSMRPGLILLTGASRIDVVELGEITDVDWGIVLLSIARGQQNQHADYRAIISLRADNAPKNGQLAELNEYLTPGPRAGNRAGGG